MARCEEAREDDRGEEKLTMVRREQQRLIMYLIQMRRQQKYRENNQTPHKHVPPRARRIRDKSERRHICDGWMPRCTYVAKSVRRGERTKKECEEDENTQGRQAGSGARGSSA